MSRYYPGFLAALSIVLLRVAIGWHFLYEGLEKVDSSGRGKEPFSAEIYLRNANGPFAPYFRDMLPDSSGRAMLDPDRLKAAWKDDATRIAQHYGFTESQRGQVENVLVAYNRWADYWFDDPENAEKRQKYLYDLRQVEKTEEEPAALSYEKERGWDARRTLDADRRKLTGPLVERGKALREAIAAIATPDQVKVSGSGGMPRTSLDSINNLTTYGLIAIGFCLIAGFLTPLAALSAAAFLAMIYLSMPPWPGLPTNPKAEGHYWIVSKNLIELLACLVIASTPSGHWIGFDALFFGARRRRIERAAREATRNTQ
jgi:uncharacterized membrane protein YphA (DoxX/SURF4 family)